MCLTAQTLEYAADMLQAIKLLECACPHSHTTTSLQLHVVYEQRHALQDKRPSPRRHAQGDIWRLHDKQPQTLSTYKAAVHALTSSVVSHNTRPLTDDIGLQHGPRQSSA